MSGAGSELVCQWHTVDASDHASGNFLIVKPVVKRLADSVGVNIHLRPETLNGAHASTVEHLFTNKSDWVVLGVHGGGE